jgi:hypothetical protein
MSKSKITLEAVEQAIAAEQQARLERRVAAPDYKPKFVLMHPSEDSALVLADYKAHHPREVAEGYDFVLIAHGAETARPELCTPTSLRAWAAREVERNAREAGAERTGHNGRQRRNADEALDRSRRC